MDDLAREDFNEQASRENTLPSDDDHHQEEVPNVRTKEELDLLEEEEFNRGRE